MPKSVLVVEDELVLNHSLVRRLRHDGFTVDGVRTAADTREAVENAWDLVLLDLHLPDAHGFELLREIHEKRPDQAVVVMTSFSSIEDAIEAIKFGAQDYVKKPCEAEELLVHIRKALEDTEVHREVEASRDKPRERAGPPAIVGETPIMREIGEMVRRVAASEASTVLITGESGTGKDLIAKAIHHESRRADEPFMTITCTAIAEQLLESELFGHEKGSFTGAVARKKGLLEIADRGTVFLDEIGDLPLSLQAKLLRFLQEKTFKRVGGTQDISVDVRIVAATHQPLPHRIEEGRFRQDLYYRLKVVDIVVPSLRERAPDILLLTRAFVAELNRQLCKKVDHITPEAEARILHHDWPGNVRELKNALERAMIVGHGDTIRVEDLPIEVRSIVVTPEDVACAVAAPALVASSATSPHPVGSCTSSPKAMSPAVSVRGECWLPPEGVDFERLERELVLQAIRVAKGNKTRAGRLLGLNRDQIRYRLQKYALALSDAVPMTLEARAREEVDGSITDRDPSTVSTAAPRTRPFLEARSASFAAARGSIRTSVRTGTLGASATASRRVRFATERTTLGPEDLVGERRDVRHHSEC